MSARAFRTVSVSVQQIVEIAKALVDHAANSDPGRADRGPFARARRSCSSPRSASSPRAGTTVLYISHRIEEIFEISDSVVVLKDGAQVLDRADRRASIATA